jgi:hypothetical protein
MEMLAEADGLSETGRFLLVMALVGLLAYAAFGGLLEYRQEPR